MAEEEPAQFGCLRYHPMLGWDSRMVYYYRRCTTCPSIRWRPRAI
jgi:hypothetical protein